MIFITIREPPKGPNLGRAVKCGPVSKLPATKGCLVCKANKAALKKTWQTLANMHGVIPGPIGDMKWHQQLYKEIWEAQEAHHKSCSTAPERQRKREAVKYSDHLGYLQRAAKRMGVEESMPKMFRELMALPPERLNRVAVFEIAEKYQNKKVA